MVSAAPTRGRHVLIITGFVIPGIIFGPGPHSWPGLRARARACGVPGPSFRAGRIPGPGIFGNFSGIVPETVTCQLHQNRLENVPIPPARNPQQPRRSPLRPAAQCPGWPPCLQGVPGPLRFALGNPPNAHGVTCYYRHVHVVHARPCPTPQTGPSHTGPPCAYTPGPSGRMGQGSGGWGGCSVVVWWGQTPPKVALENPTLSMSTP